MKKLEKLRKLPKCDTNTQGEQCYWKNGANKFARGWVATNLQCVKKKKKYLWSKIKQDMPMSSPFTAWKNLE